MTDQELGEALIRAGTALRLGASHLSQDLKHILEAALPRHDGRDSPTILHIQQKTNSDAQSMTIRRSLEVTIQLSATNLNDYLIPEMFRNLTIGLTKASSGAARAAAAINSALKASATPHHYTLDSLGNPHPFIEPDPDEDFDHASHGP